MRALSVFLLTIGLLLSGCTETIDKPFYADWKFNLGEVDRAQSIECDDSQWQSVQIPHDWSIHQSYTTKNAAASTGFLPGGIGWYRKSFVLDEESAGKHIRVEFDGIYNNSMVWINGVLLGERPYGYSSFSYDLSDHLLEAGKENLIAVRVDRTNYADSRWYTGSGIYRDVRLIVTDEVHIPQWGVRISTPTVEKEHAILLLKTQIDPGSRSGETVSVEIEVKDPSGAEVAAWNKELELSTNGQVTAEIQIEEPDLWSLETPNLYTASVSLKQGSKLLDRSIQPFGIRSIRFDADRGFFLNDKSVKMKGVNIHHDAGCLGAAVPKDIWVSRISKLKSMGCNAIRTSHNPHDPQLITVCDELGMLVVAEAFDEWSKPKEKHLTWLGSADAGPDVATSYPERFLEWGERDIKDLVRRDYNHPSVIMWSIGNEVEWTFPYYPQSSSYAIGNLDDEYFNNAPNYDPKRVLERMKKIHPGPDTLYLIAKELVKWVKEIDNTRFVTNGSVHPSVGFATGYCTEVDVVGFNYRAAEYDEAHRTYPDAMIYGSENWVTWPEWKAVNDRDFVAGIFLWTGFAYMGEAGPWPRKGLTFSLFDFAGNLTPRGHFFETFWKEDPKVYMATIPESESEFSFSKESGWSFTEKTYEIPKMSWLRKWDWYALFEKWNYKSDERIMVQGYTNCEEAELFLNGKSLGRRTLAQFDDRILKWLVPYQQGELKLIGYNKGVEAHQYTLNTHGKAARVELLADRLSMEANQRDVAMVQAQVVDNEGNPVRNQELEIQFHLEGDAHIIGVDNGWEFNVQDALSDHITTHQGRALVVIQAGSSSGKLSVEASHSDIESGQTSIIIK